MKVRISIVAALSALLLGFGCKKAEEQKTPEPKPEPTKAKANDKAGAGDAPKKAADMAKGHIIGPDKADHLWSFAKSKDDLGSGAEFHIYVDAETHPNATASFASMSLGVGGALPTHKHEKTEEIAYFLSGEGVVIMYEGEEAKEYPVKEGVVWYMPPGVNHSFKNTSKDDKLSLVFAVIPNDKKGLLSFFRQISAKPGEDPPEMLPPADFAKIAAEHDLVLMPPPAKK